MQDQGIAVNPTNEGGLAATNAPQSLNQSDDSGEPAMSDKAAEVKVETKKKEKEKEILFCR
jgi:hypothetical protein